MILRIEDTDRNRYVEGAEDYIMNSLEWCAIIPDESPKAGGAFGPYRQSERLSIYKNYADQLIKDGKAYIAFDTPEEIDAMRERQKAAKSSIQQYAAGTRMQMRNSLTLSEDQVSELIESGVPYVIRLKVPEGREIVVQDIVRGEVRVNSDIVDDKVLLKSDGYPTYHLANVVDDHLMQISHVIRGEEWLPSAPLHALLYEFLGWTDTMPEMAHLPLLLKPEGSGKLSKRDADKHGFPIFPLNWQDPKTGEVAVGFKESGYLPEATVNFLALLGWNPGNDEEIFSMSELIEKFQLERIGKSGAKFDIEKAKWYNEYYLRNKDNDKLSVFLIQDAKKEGVEIPKDKAVGVCGLLKDRITFPQDLWNQGRFFFVIPTEYDEKFARKKWTAEGAEVLKEYAQELDNVDLNDKEAAKQKLYDVSSKHDVGFGKVMPALRLALTGSGGGPDIFDIMKILGNHESKARILRAIDVLA